MTRLVFFSDFICPWCYLAERGTLEPVQERYELDFQWNGFELHPSIPAGGMDLSQMFPASKVREMQARLQDVADGLGVEIHARDHAPSTKPALALSEFARQHGRLDAFRSLAMDAHWKEGRDIEDRAVLRDLAESAGLDADAAIAFLDDAAVPQLLRRQREQAQAWGVTGIPTWFMLPDGWEPEHGIPESGPRPVRVVGCQPLEIVEKAAGMAGATPRS